MLNNLWTQPTHGFYVRFWLASTFTLLSFLAAGCAPEGQSVSDTCAPVGTDASDTIDFGGSVDGAAQTADVPPSAVFDIIELPTSCTSDQFSSTVGPYHLAQGLVLAQGSVWVARAYSSPGIWKYAFPKSGPISPLAYSDLPSNNFVRVLAAGADGGLYVGGFESIDLPNGKAPETERWWLAHYSASAKLVTVHYGPNVHGHRQYVRELAIRADTGVSALVTDLTEDGQLSDSIVNFSANDTVLDSLGLTQATGAGTSTAQIAFGPDGTLHTGVEFLDSAGKLHAELQRWEKGKVIQHLPIEIDVMARGVSTCLDIWPSQIIVTKAGSTVAGGALCHFGASLDLHWLQWIANISPSGQTRWQTFLSGDYVLASEGEPHLVLLPIGSIGYLILAPWNHIGYSESGPEAQLVFIDPLGNLQWQRKIGGVGSVSGATLDGGLNLFYTFKAYGGGPASNSVLIHATPYGYTSCAEAQFCWGKSLQDCDDADPCTADNCDPEIGCTHKQFKDGAMCSFNGGKCLKGVCN